MTKKTWKNTTCPNGQLNGARIQKSSRVLNGTRHPLVQLRQHAPGRGRAAYVVLHAGHRRAGRCDGGVLHLD